MSKKVDLKQLDCRGRNGLFKYNGHYAIVGHDYAYVGIHSKRRGNTSPIVICGDIEATIHLFESITHDLKQAKRMMVARDAFRDLRIAVENKKLNSSQDLIDQCKEEEEEATFNG